MATKLRSLKLREVSAVTDGANQHAHIVLYKGVPGLPHPHLGFSRGSAPKLKEPRAWKPRRSIPQLRASKMLNHDDSAYLDLIKRTFTAEERRNAASSGAAMPGGRYPIENKSDLENAIHAVGRGKGSHATIRAHIMRRARALGATDLIPDSWKGGGAKKLLQKLRELFVKDGGDARDFDQVLDASEAREDAADMLEEIDDAVNALRTAIYENLNDDGVSDKGAACDTVFQQFKDHLADLVPEEMEKALAAGIAAATAGATGKEGETMDKSKLRKALGLAESATDADVEKAIGDAVAAGSFLANVEKMSQAHSAYMNNPKAKMPDGGKKKFASMSPGERDDHMKANPVASDDDGDEDASKKLEKLLKGLPPEVAAMVKAGQTALADVTKLREQNELTDIEKRIEPLKHVGKAADVAKLLLTIRKAHAPTADAVEAILKQLNEVIAKGAVFTEHGSGHAGVSAGNATATINKMAEELKKADPKLSIEKARTMVRDRNPELVKQEDTERRDRRAA